MTSKEASTSYWNDPLSLLEDPAGREEVQTNNPVRCGTAAICQPDQEDCGPARPERLT